MIEFNRLHNWVVIFVIAAVTFAVTKWGLKAVKQQDLANLY